MGNHEFEDGCNNSFSNHEKETVLIVMSSTASTSFIVCVFASCVVVCLKLHRIFTYRLIVYQVFGSMVVSSSEALSSILLVHKSKVFWHDACLATAFYMEYAMWVKLLSTICLVFHLFCLAVFYKSFQRYELAYILLPLALPLLISWAPFIHRTYGPAGAWCWIRDWKDDCATQKYMLGIAEQFGLWYGPLFISLTAGFLAVVIVFFTIALRAKRGRQSNENSEIEPLLEAQQVEQYKRALKQLLPILAYPGIYYTLCLFPIANRIYSAISPQTNLKLALAHSVSISLWGLFSSLGLLLHILILKRLGRRRTRPTSIQSRSANQFEDITYTAAAVFTTENPSEVEGRYRGSIPSESYIDKCFQ